MSTPSGRGCSKPGAFIAGRLDEARFVWTGTITPAVVTGLCTAARTPEYILLSPRNTEPNHRYAGVMIHGLSVFGTEAGAEGLGPLTQEHQTPGGLNEQPCGSLPPPAGTMQ